METIRTPYALGALQRPTAPGELVYRQSAAPALNLAGTYSIVPWRTKTEQQGQLAACVAQAVTSAAEILANVSGQPVPDLDRLWLYARTRQAEGSFPGNVGTYPADALDIARKQGLPPESAEKLGYIEDATYNPGPDVDAQATYKVVASHQPFYQTDAGGFYGGICTALAAKKPVVIACNWYDEFFEPAEGVLPGTYTHADGGHCFHALLTFTHKTLGRLVLCRNSWGTTWTDAGVKNIHPDAEPGDFFVPEKLLLDGTVWECRAVSGLSIPKPKPVVVPTRKVFVNLWTQGTPDWSIKTVQVGEIPAAGAWVQIGESKSGEQDKMHDFVRIEA